MSLWPRSSSWLGDKKWTISWLSGCCLLIDQSIDWKSISVLSQRRRLKLPASRLFTKENVKALRDWPFWGNSPGPVNSQHRGQVTRKMLPFDDVILSIFVPDSTTVRCKSDAYHSTNLEEDGTVRCRQPTSLTRRVCSVSGDVVCAQTAVLWASILQKMCSRT